MLKHLGSDGSFKLIVPKSATTLVGRMKTTKPLSLHIQPSPGYAKKLASQN
jgi:hypothetical protein